MAIYGDKEITISNQRGLIYGDLEITISNQEKIPWINNPYIKSLYILGTEKVDTSFINGKGLE
jgi:competence transcription factor ComK